MTKQIKSINKEKTRNRSPGVILLDLLKLDHTLYQDMWLAGELASDGVLAKAIAQSLLAHKETYMKGNYDG